MMRIEMYWFTSLQKAYRYPRIINNADLATVEASIHEAVKDKDVSSIMVYNEAGKAVFSAIREVWTFGATPLVLMTDKLGLSSLIEQQGRRY